jgi:hypothetical protein
MTWVERVLSNARRGDFTAKTDETPSASRVSSVLAVDLPASGASVPMPCGDADGATDAGTDSPPYWPIQVRWGTLRGDIAVRDPWTGAWHEFPYRDAPEVWKLALRLSLSKPQPERTQEAPP